ncbi:hypothetical protein HanIR_Chr01g0037781 [Helianthus annuus]|nr:hypothetical protein HanIR_Chr01g0037781 [Helianthus annuus]
MSHAPHVRAFMSFTPLIFLLCKPLLLLSFILFNTLSVTDHNHSLATTAACNRRPSE